MCLQADRSRRRLQCRGFSNRFRADKTSQSRRSLTTTSWLWSHRQFVEHPWINSNKHRLRYHAGQDGHMRFSSAVVHATSRVRNTQSRAQDELTRQRTRCAGQLSHSTPCAEQQQPHRSHCADQKLTHVDLAGKELGYTKAKFKTSRAATRILFTPNLRRKNGNMKKRNEKT